MKKFWKYGLLILTPFLILSCAAPITQPVNVNEVLVAIEAQKQRELYLQKWMDLRNRLDSVAFPLLKAAIPFCADNVWPSVGFSFDNKYNFSPEYYDAAVAVFGVREVLQITYVIPNSNAEKAGVLAGDTLVSINDTSLPVGKNAKNEMFKLLRSHLVSDKKVKISVLRNGEKLDFVFIPEDICEIPTACVFNSNDLNAFADGKSVFVTKGMMRFVKNDQELALVLAHEIAHNIMGHIDAQQQNYALGSIIDILAAIYGIDTRGTFGRIGARQYSQEFEFEADAIGLYLMVRSGFEIENTVMFWRNMGSESPQAIRQNPSSSHPSSPERFAAIEEHIKIIKDKQQSGLPLLPGIKQPLRSETQQSSSKNKTVQASYSEDVGSNVNQWLDKSMASLEAKDWIEAIRTASVAIRLNPNHPTGYVNRSWAYIEKGLYEKALSDCQKAIELDNSNSMAINNRGLVSLRTGDQDLAVKDFELGCQLGLEVSCRNYKEILGYLPAEKIEVMLDQTMKHFSSGNYEEVVDLSTKIIEVDPHNEIAFSNRCGAFANKSLWDKAKQDCLEAITINPDYAMAYNNLGYVLEQEGNELDATINYEISCNLGLNLGCKNLKRFSLNDQH